MRPRSVTASVIAGFGACLLVLVALMVWATNAAFEHERSRAESALDAAARTEADALAGYAEEVLPYLADLGRQPALAEFASASCRATLAPLDGLATGIAVVLLDPGGDVVCTLPADTPVSLPEEVVSGATSVSDVFVDEVSGTPAFSASVPVAGPAGAGTLAMVVQTGVPALHVAEAVDPRTVLVALDPDRTIVVATSPDAPYGLGDLVREIHLADPLGDESATIVDPDGTRRIWREVRTDDGWAVLAGLDEGVALAGAHEQRRSLALVGTGAFAVVVVLAVALQRRLARPIRRLGAAIRASRAGDRDARAPDGGPSEIADVAAAFNELVDAQQALEDRLRYSAMHDALTGLPNRRHVTEFLDRVLADPAAEPVAVLFIDLDRFKLVNDSHGHAVGDELLVALANRLVAAVPSGWLVSRFGGDEFLVVCPSCTDAVPEAARIGDILRSTIVLGGHELTVGGSVGIAIARRGDRADDLIREADTAMYRAKDAGRGGFAVFDDDMRSWTIARLSTERDLRGAVERDELRLHLQPIVDVETGRAAGAEALVRWQHPGRGLLAPAAFVGIAEETDLIAPLTEWVLEQAARQAVTWREDVGRPVPVSVNLGPRQLVSGSVFRMVTDVLARTGAHATDLVIEVTESAVLTDVDAAAAQLAALRRIGVRVAIDDFGTGYSSLAYLRDLPADELKIDRSFIARVGEDPVSTAIVRSVVDLAHAVGMVVVAEGVETADQLETLAALGCDRVQGFYLARPAPGADLPISRTSLAAAS